MPLGARELLIALGEVQRVVTGESQELHLAIARVRGVLNDAAETLRESFEKLGSASPSACAEANEPLAEAVSQAIRSLQFEDIVRQQLEYADARLSGVEELMRGIEKLCAELQQSRARTQAADGVVLDELARGLSGGVETWIEGRARHVTTQDSVESGSVELF